MTDNFDEARKRDLYYTPEELEMFRQQKAENDREAARIRKELGTPLHRRIAKFKERSNDLL